MSSNESNARPPAVGALGAPAGAKRTASSALDGDGDRDGTDGGLTRLSSFELPSGLSGFAEPSKRTCVDLGLSADDDNGPAAPALDGDAAARIADQDARSQSIRPRNEAARKRFALISDDESESDDDDGTGFPGSQPIVSIPRPQLAAAGSRVSAADLGPSWQPRTFAAPGAAAPKPPTLAPPSLPPAPASRTAFGGFPLTDDDLDFDMDDGIDADADAELEARLAFEEEMIRESMMMEAQQQQPPANQFTLPRDTQAAGARSGPFGDVGQSMALDFDSFGPEDSIRLSLGNMELDPLSQLPPPRPPLYGAPPASQAQRANGFRAEPTARRYARATTADGTELFFPRREPHRLADETQRGAAGALLQEDVGEIIREICESMPDADDDALRHDPLRLPLARPEQDLWVDRYRPRTYLDLIGDEAVARAVLAWVRAWDPCVFGKKPPAQQVAKETSRFGISDGIGDETDLHDDGTPVYQPSSTLVELTPGDPMHRPAKKVLLLAGPPGLGKSTLVHIIARQAGYDVTEINASDDRTARSVQDRIENAMGGTTIVNGKVSKRPRLVVLDEIDGATGGGGGGGAGGNDANGLIKQLVQMAESATRHRGGKPKPRPGITDMDVDGAPVAQRRNNKEQDGSQLRRPIICICNDLYAPALRPLRQIARIVQVWKPDTHAVLVRRLTHICQREGIRASIQTLHWLADRAEGDIRACLHALQFAHRSAVRDRRAAGGSSAKRVPVIITKATLENSQLGTKDTSRSLPSLWDAMFSAAAAQELAAKVFAKSKTAVAVPGSISSIAGLAHAIDGHGDWDKIAVGLHEYLVQARSHDFARYGEALDALVDFDTLHSLGFRTSGNAGAIHQYVPWTLAALHLQFRTGLTGNAGGAAGRIEYPKQDYDAFVRQRDHRQILHSLARNANPRKGYTLTTLSAGTLVTDLVAGPLARILSPPGLRHANLLLMPAAERAKFDALVGALHGLNVRLVHDSVDGVQTFRLEPPIQVICGLAMANGKIKSLLPASFPVRQLIATQLETSAIRAGAGQQQIADDAVGTVREKAQSSVAAAILAGQDGKVERDFFGRPIVRPEPTATQLERANARVSGHPELRVAAVRYKFHEGYSNAVRKPVYMRSLLG
ncbi:Chromosome transmission fidelity protein 18 [Blastocladiella emersonii ATCC 22665]|nr:Chromosome transmission fidelity protein 18 [Blastocladiella emersonii ATCC 22665]